MFLNSEPEVSNLATAFSGFALDNTKKNCYTAVIDKRKLTVPMSSPSVINLHQFFLVLSRVATNYQQPIISTVFKVHLRFFYSVFFMGHLELYYKSTFTRTGKPNPSSAKNTASPNPPSANGSNSTPL